MSEFLYTSGNELIYQDGRPYIGPYHVMVDGTPMSGNTHSGNDQTLSFITPPNEIIRRPPSSFFNTGYELSDQEIIPSFETGSSFDIDRDNIELFIYDANKTFLASRLDYEDYRVENNTSTELSTIDEILITPDRDVFNLIERQTGNYYAVYNFITPELSSSLSSPYFISQISSDGTEIRLQNNFIDNNEIRSSFNSLKNKIDSSNFFDEFYITPGQNENYIGVNILLDESQEDLGILIKLYEPLPPNITTKSQVTAFSKISETQIYEVKFNPPPPTRRNTSLPLRGPNVNIPIQDQVNNSTEFKTLSLLTTSSFTSSLDQSKYLLNQTGITLNPSYSISDYSDFVHFSSAKKRLNNFYYKVGQIESFQNNINSLTAISPATSETSASVNIFRNKITDIIQNFDGFDYFLYYTSGSNSYPKSNSTAPFTLYSTGSTEALTWLGSDVAGNIYYGGAIYTASRYDDDNPSNLIYTIPEYVRSNTDNQSYIDFSNMVGQHFDEIWLYIRAITNKLKNTNNSETGIAPQIVEETLKSFGYEVYGNNFNNSDLFTGLIGINNSGSFFPNTENEVINTFVSASDEPVPIESVSKEIYKRLYHNLVYLAKRKGTISGLRSLINIWGLPDTILRINEFGGKDKVNSNDWDLYRRIFNNEITSFQIDADLGEQYNGGVETLWKLNTLWSSSAAITGLTGSIPSTVEFRFKSDIDPSVTPTSSIPLQPLWGLRDNSGDTKVLAYLEYNGSGPTSGSFSGSAIDPNYQYADLTLAIDGTPPVSKSISLPFYNQDWWNVRIQMQQENEALPNESLYSLTSANKIYNGKDGTKLGFKDSLEINYNSGSWVDSTTSSFALGRDFNSITYPNFSGSLQEIRYWTLCFKFEDAINEEVWNNHVMNPLSIETGYLTGSLSPVNQLVFRSREGEDLTLISGSQGDNKDLESIHPRITGSYLTTSSFADDSGTGLHSLYSLISSSIDDNKEIQFLNQPSLGVKNRVTDKVRDYGDVAYENVLSQYRSIQQNYEASQSFTEDTNLLEVAFSPQDEINDDITHEFGFNNQITDQISDPRNLSSSLDYYDGLRDIALKYFEKYIKADPTDYFRLIKYIDNSLFKAIKNYVPARTSVSTGIIVKQHLLERNRVRPPQVNPNTTIAITPESEFNTPLTFKDITISGSVKSQPRNFITGSPIQVFEGGTGGSFEKFNTVDFSPLGPSGSGPVRTFGFEITQSFTETVSDLSGSITRIVDNQDEFYNGEFSGSQLIITTQSLNPGCAQFLNIFTTPPPTSSFDYYLYNELFTCSLDRFRDVRTTPNSGEMFIGYTSAGPFIRDFKMSTTDKEGNDITSILDNATRFSFDFGTGLENFNVTRTNQGSGFIQYLVNELLPSSPEYLLSSSYEEYPFSASSSASLSSSVGVGTIFFQPNGDSTSIILSNYDSEDDDNNVFNASTGFYTLPGTPNLPIFYSGSVNYSGSINNSLVQTPIGSASVSLILKNQTLPAFSQYVSSLDLNIASQTSLEFSGSFAISGSFNQNVPIKSDELALELNLSLPGLEKGMTFISGSITGSGAEFSVFTGSRFPFPSETTLTSFEPYLPLGFSDFERHIDCQPLFNNISNNRLSTLYFDVDYTSGLLNPINILPITNRDAELFPIPDSNYTSQRSILPRYNGSKLNGLILNKYSPPGTSYTENNIQKTWEGDFSFGKEPVIEQTKPFFGFFQLLLPTSPELEFATQAKLKYIIGLDGQPYKPIPKQSPSFFDVEGTFEQGNIVDVSLDDTLQTDDPSLTNAAVGINLDNFNKRARVIKGARRIDPVLTTQKVSIYDEANANDAFESSINIINPPNITTDYSLWAYSDQGFVPLSASPLKLPFNVVSFDNSGGYNNSSFEFTFSEDTQTPVSFQTNVTFKVNSTNPSGTQGMLRMLRERGGVRDNLISRLMIIPQGVDRINVTLTSPPEDFRDGDKVYVRASIPNFGGSSFDQDDNQFPVGNSSVREFLPVSFKAFPNETPLTSINAPFFTTGSNYTNQLTGSVSMSMILNQVQKPYNNTTFKPFNEPFNIQPGDEFRFEGREDRVFLVNKVTLNDTSTASTGSIFIQVQPPIPPLINLDQFLIRRYNEDGTSVLIDLIPPSSSFATTKGLIKNEFINEKLEENINNIVAKLSTEGII